MVGRFAGSVKEFKLHAPERELVLVIKQDCCFDLCAVVARPLLRRWNAPRELRGIATRKKSREPRLIVDELDVVSLRDYLSARLLPLRHAARVIRVSMREDDVFDWAADCRTKKLSVNARVEHVRGVNYHVALGS